MNLKLNIFIYLRHSRDEFMTKRSKNLNLSSRQSWIRSDQNTQLIFDMTTKSLLRNLMTKVIFKIVFGIGNFKMLIPFYRFLDGDVIKISNFHYTPQNCRKRNGLFNTLVRKMKTACNESFS